MLRSAEIVLQLGYRERGCPVSSSRGPRSSWSRRGLSVYGGYSYRVLDVDCAAGWRSVG
jgi:hypothetical protein